MKKIFLNIGIGILTLAICILLAEVIVRFLAPQQLLTADPGIWDWNERGSLCHNPNVNVIINHGEGNHHFLTDEYGYRINYTETAYSDRDNPDIAILGMGDSFLEAVSLENEETAPELLAGMLFEEYGIRSYVANAGCSSRNPLEYYHEVQRAFSHRSFDVGIVLLFTGNDIMTEKMLERNPRPPREREMEHVPFGTKRWVMLKVAKPTKHFLECNSHLFTLLKHVSFAFLIRSGRTLTAFPTWFFTREADKDLWDVTTGVCRQIDEEFKAHDAQVLFVMVPTVWQVTEELFYDYIELTNIPADSVDIDQPNRQLQPRFEAAGLHYIDPLERMRELTDQGEQLFGNIDRHFNARGQEVLAEVVYPYLVEQIRPLLASDEAAVTNP